MKNCPKCGTEVENRAQFCPNCGYKFDTFSSDSESDSWTRQQHKEFDDQPNEQEKRVKPKSGKGKTFTIIILVLIILGAAGGVIYGFGSQLESNQQDQSSSQDESSSKKVIKETNSDGMSDNSSSESSDTTSSSSSSSDSDSSSNSSSSSSNDNDSSSSEIKSVTSRDGSVLNGFFNSLSAAANGSDNSDLSDYFINGDSNPSIQQYQNWSKGQSNNADLSNVTCTVQNLSMNSGAGHSNADFDVKYHFTYNDGETKTQVFKFNAKLERDDDGNFKILSCEPESTPIYSSNN